MKNSARYEAVWVNGTWAVRDRWVWNHQPVIPPLKKEAELEALRRNSGKSVH